MRLELTRVGLLVELANHYTTRETKTNSTFHAIKTAIVEELNKMSEESILKVFKSNGGHIEKIYCFVSRFLFYCLFLYQNIPNFTSVRCT